jgi:hypothetical protein
MSIETASPKRIDTAQMKRVEVEAMAPWPTGIRGDSHKYGAYEVFVGEFTMYVYQSDPGILNFTDYPFDEYVHLLSGSAILTDASGQAQVFKAGDSFIVPAGFTGTWALQGDYRELFMIETRSLAAGLEKLGLA